MWSQTVEIAGPTRLAAAIKGEGLRRGAGGPVVLGDAMSAARRTQVLAQQSGRCPDRGGGRGCHPTARRRGGRSSRAAPSTRPRRGRLTRRLGAVLDVLDSSRSWRTFARSCGTFAMNSYLRTETGAMAAQELARRPGRAAFEECGTCTVCLHAVQLFWPSRREKCWVSDPETGVAHPFGRTF